MKLCQLQGAAFDLGVAASPPLLRANLLELLLQSAKRTPRSTAIAEMDDMFCGKILWKILKNNEVQISEPASFGLPLEQYGSKRSTHATSQLPHATLRSLRRGSFAGSPATWLNLLQDFWGWATPSFSLAQLWPLVSSFACEKTVWYAVLGGEWGVVLLLALFEVLLNTESTMPLSRPDRTLKGDEISTIYIDLLSWRCERKTQQQFADLLIDVFPCLCTLQRCCDSRLLRKRKDRSSTAAVLSERSAAAVVGLMAALPLPLKLWWLHLTTSDYYWVPHQTVSLRVLNGFDAFLIICYHL